ncbi:MAG TPA: tetratricopeptide repeat protein [Bacteroidia bacterium]|nr:tetratricopeptide repeat protein [Bacteroidia bacterium]
MKSFAFPLLMFFILWGATLHSQSQQKIDSLKIFLKTAKEDTNKVRALNRLVLLQNTAFPDIAIANAEKAFALAEKLNYSDGQAAALIVMGGAYMTKGNFTKSLECQEKALKIFEATGKKNEIAPINNNMGSVYVEQGNYDKALACFLASLKIEEELGEKVRIAATAANIGVLFQNKGGLTGNIREYEEALKYHNKAYALDKQLGDKFGISVDLNNLGSVYCDMGKLNPSREIFLKALEYLEESLKIKEEVKDLNGLAIVQVNLCDVYTQLGMLEKNANRIAIAIPYGQKALAGFRLIGDPYGTAFTLNKIGQAYFEWHALSHKNAYLDSTIYYLNEGLKIATEIGAKDQLKDGYSNLSEVYEKKGNFREALIYERFYSSIKDTLLNEENARHMNEMQTKYETAEKDKALIRKDAEISKEQAASKQKATERNASIIGFSLMGVLAFFIFRGYRQKKKANEIITLQKSEVELQRDIIGVKNKDITDSINYARRIQRAMITSESFFKKNLPDYFIYYKPKDIVSGDFYWGCKTATEDVLIATGDCTGHGVPGAFMSTIGVSKLNEVVVGRKVSRPSDILDQLRSEVINALNPEGAEEESSDGMDISLCAFRFDTMKLEYAGANNSIYIIRNSELTEKKPDKMPVGKFSGQPGPFTNNEIALQKGDCVYSFTDGYADQFGGEKGKKFKYKQLEELLVSIHGKPMNDQKIILDGVMKTWKGPLEQVDDMLIIGVRV